MSRTHAVIALNFSRNFRHNIIELGKVLTQVVGCSYLHAIEFKLQVSYNTTIIMVGFVVDGHIYIMITCMPLPLVVMNAMVVVVYSVPANFFHSVVLPGKLERPTVLHTLSGRHWKVTCLEWQ